MLVAFILCRALASLKLSPMTLRTLPIQRRVLQRIQARRQKLNPPTLPAERQTTRAAVNKERLQLVVVQRKMQTMPLLTAAFGRRTLQVQTQLVNRQ